LRPPEGPAGTAAGEQPSSLAAGSAAAEGRSGAAAPQELIGATRPGAAVRRPGIANALAAIARDGRRAFYEGPFGEGLLALGAGEFAPADLERSGADWVAPLGLRFWGRQGWTVPPNSQGYLTLAGAWIAEGLDLQAPADARWAHGLIEAAAAARRDRDAVLHEHADGRALLAPDRLAAQRAAVDPARAADPVALRGDGGTTALAAVDPDGMGVALIQSNFHGWGTGLFVEGIALHNRGAAFSLRAGDGAEYGPGRRPPHTLAPLLVARPDGSLHTLLAAMGGQSQPEILLQVLARRLRAGEPPGDALAAARWVLTGDGVAVEAHAPADWFEGLPARGHRLRRRPAFSDRFGHANLIAVEDDHLAAAADPRTGSGSASGF
jgi:gamma-glutamyltranspeptidase/glutathione hydrolase